MGLFRSSGSGSIAEGDDDDDDYIPEVYRSTPWYEQWFAPHKEPQVAGVNLLLSGEFGRVISHLETQKGHKNISRVLLDRTSRRNGIQREELIGVSAFHLEEWLPVCKIIPQDLIPNSNGAAVASHGANLYVGQFSRGAFTKAFTPPTD